MAEQEWVIACHEDWVRMCLLSVLPSANKLKKFKAPDISEITRYFNFITINKSFFDKKNYPHTFCNEDGSISLGWKFGRSKSSVCLEVNFETGVAWIYSITRVKELRGLMLLESVEDIFPLIDYILEELETNKKLSSDFRHQHLAMIFCFSKMRRKFREWRKSTSPQERKPYEILLNQWSED